MDYLEIRRTLRTLAVVKVLEKVGYNLLDYSVSGADDNSPKVEIRDAEAIYGIVTIAKLVAAGITPTVYALTEGGGVYRFEVSDFPNGTVTAIIDEGAGDAIATGQVYSIFDWSKVDVTNIPAPLLSAALQAKVAEKPAPINYRMRNQNVGQVWRNSDAVMSADALLEVCGLELWAAIRAAIETGEMVGFHVEFADHRVSIERVG